MVNFPRCVKYNEPLRWLGKQKHENEKCLQIIATEGHKRKHHPKQSVSNFLQIQAIPYTTWKVDGQPLPCIGLLWPLTNRHLLGVAIAIYFHHSVSQTTHPSNVNSILEILRLQNDPNSFPLWEISPSPAS